MHLMVNNVNEIRKMNLNINNIQKNQIINNEYITDTYLKNQFILFENNKKDKYDLEKFLFKFKTHNDVQFFSDAIATKVKNNKKYLEAKIRSK